ncbi:MAG: YopX family protein [Nanoarchaeota archaeon]
MNKRNFLKSSFIGSIAAFFAPKVLSKETPPKTTSWYNSNNPQTLTSIKYRIWDKLRKKYLYDFNDLAIMQDGSLIRLFPFENVEKDRFIIQRFTGLYDIDKKKIYEEDVILVKIIGYPLISMKVYFSNEKGGWFVTQTKKSNYRTTWMLTKGITNNSKIIDSNNSFINQTKFSQIHENRPPKTL